MKRLIDFNGGKYELFSYYTDVDYNTTFYIINYKKIKLMIDPILTLLKKGDIVKANTHEYEIKNFYFSPACGNHTI